MRLDVATARQKHSKRESEYEQDLESEIDVRKQRAGTEKARSLGLAHRSQPHGDHRNGQRQRAARQYRDLSHPSVPLEAAWSRRTSLARMPAGRPQRMPRQRIMRDYMSSGFAGQNTNTLRCARQSLLFATAIVLIACSSTPRREAPPTPPASIPIPSRSGGY